MLMNLRWSLAIISLSSFVYTSYAVPVPGKGDDPKAPSKEYRANAENAPYGFQLSPGGTTVDRFHETGPRPPRPQEDADHLLEAQTLHHALRAQGHEYRNLPAHHQAGLRHILNDGTNMAFIDRSLNRGKGQVVRHGNEGHQLGTHNPGRDAYTRATIPNAVHTADRLDAYLVQHGYQGNVRDTHTRTMRNAGILGHNERTPENTPAHHNNAQAGPGPGTLANRMAALNLHGTGGHTRSSSSSSSSSDGSAPHSPTPNRLPGPSHQHHQTPSTPPRQGTHDHTLGTHAPRADRTHPGIFGPIPPLPRLDAHHDQHHHDSPPHTPPHTPHHGAVPVTPAHQTGNHGDHHNLGQNAPPRRPLVRSNSFGGTPSRPLAAQQHPPHSPPSPSHGHGPHKP